MLKPTKEYKSANFTASLSDDPSGIWFLDVKCKTEKNGVKGTVIGHIPLCIQFEQQDDGTEELVLSVMDDVDDEIDEVQEEEDNIITFPFGKKR
ncbi:MAG: hypothetical protein K6G51_07425 [Sphaerochaetaceae bacterium]|nr:hypothetical protein [Sphaerochaetaceae bacterium]